MRNYWGSVLSLVVGVGVSVVSPTVFDPSWVFYAIVGALTVVAAVLLWPKPSAVVPPAPALGAYMRGTQKGNKHTGSVDTDASVVYDGDSENTEFGAKIKQRRPKT